MEKHDLIMKIRSKSGVSQNDIRKTLEALQAVIHEELSSGRDVEIPDFGKYTVVSYATNNPQAVSPEPIIEITTQIINENDNLVGRIINKNTLGIIPKHIAKHFQVVPIEERNDALLIAMADTLDSEAIKFLKKKINKNLHIRSCSQEELEHILKQYA